MHGMPYGRGHSLLPRAGAPGNNSVMASTASHQHHGHDHGHAHGPPDMNRAFAIGVALNLGFVVAEIGFGLAANSLALLSDAGHNASDVLGLIIAWVGIRLAKAIPTKRRTYGL